MLKSSALRVSPKKELRSTAHPTLLIFNYSFDSKEVYSRDECLTFAESNPQGYGKILNNGPRVFDKPSPKRRRRLIVDGRSVWPVYFISAYNGDPLQARAY
jgi:hypothetical protein